MFDTHCHIHDTQFYKDGRADAYRRATDAGVSMLVVGTGQEDSRQAVRFAEEHDDTWAIIGVHPHDTKDGWGDIQTLLEQGSRSIKGVGEIGLDYYYNHSPRETQMRALEEQLSWAVAHDLPVSFHVREAFDDFWPIFDSFKGVRGVLHSFTDSKCNADEALKRGLYIGVNGISTFTKDAAQQALFASLPLDRILLETDAPFLTPVPFRGKVNEPAFVEYVAQHHAKIRGVSLEEVIVQTSTNARALFAL